MSIEEFKALLKKKPGHLKAGPIVTVTDVRGKSQHVAMLALLQKQFNTVETERKLSPSLSPSPTPTPKGNGPTSGQTGNGGGHASKCPVPQVETMNGLPIPNQNQSIVSTGKGGKFGQSGGGTPTPVQTISAYFTTVPEYNLYPIRGCDFGAVPGVVQISGPFSVKGGIYKLDIASWSDSQIVASIDNPLGVFGENDIRGAVSLQISKYRESLPSVQANGFSFYARRAEYKLIEFPKSLVNAPVLVDSEGSAVQTEIWSTTGDFLGNQILGWSDPNNDVSVEVDRLGSGSFASAQDSFNLNNVLPGFSFSKYQFLYADWTTVCSAGDGPAGSNGNWSAVWDSHANVLRVTTAELSCYGVASDGSFVNDGSVSAYALVFWVFGPYGASPWPNQIWGPQTSRSKN